MTKQTEMVIEFFKPCLERQYVNGAHKYQTNMGLKTMEELVTTVEGILLRYRYS